MDCCALTSHDTPRFRVLLLQAGRVYCSVYHRVDHVLQLAAFPLLICPFPSCPVSQRQLGQA